MSEGSETVEEEKTQRINAQLLYCDDGGRVAKYCREVDPHGRKVHAGDLDLDHLMGGQGETCENKNNTDHDVKTHTIYAQGIERQEQDKE